VVSEKLKTKRKTKAENNGAISLKGNNNNASAALRSLTALKKLQNHSYHKINHQSQNFDFCEFLCNKNSVHSSERLKLLGLVLE